MTYDGGYYLIKSPLVREGLNAHTASSSIPIPQRVLDAVNIVQATPWRINTFVLDTMREAWDRGATIAGLPDPENEQIPDRIPEETWEAWEPTQRRDWKYKLEKIHSSNASLQGKRESFLRKLNVAHEMRDRQRIYFPHFMDFRGRMYPMVQDLTPQADHVAKALLEFAEGVPIGNEGLYWLYQRLTQAAGLDKMSTLERERWCVDNMRDIVLSAQDPLSHQWWAQFSGDEPWQVLATCKEISEALNCEDPATYVSHLPIPLDGSCNGLQHLSFLARDRVGARATNCTSVDQRFDLYQEVADEVSRLNQLNLGLDVAKAWAGRINRKVVKRAVMTTPYGVTDRGIQDQLFKDGHADGIEEAMYMRNLIKEALSNTVVSARNVMAFIQDLAAVLADGQHPFAWTTPDGFQVVQAYKRLNAKRVDTLAGTLVLFSEDKNDTLMKKKQVLASAPNFIHSLDATHLRSTVRSCYAQGIEHFAMIHDSFGTHAGNTRVLWETLRREMSLQYEDDLLLKLREEAQSQTERELPPLPVYGDLDVTEVLNAEYFFS